MKKFIKYLTVLIIFFSIAWILSKPLIGRLGVPFEFDIIYKAKSSDVFQVFYTDGVVTNNFDEKYSIKENIEGNNTFNTIKYTLPISNLNKLRLDIGKKPGTVVIKELRLKKFFNSYVWTADDIRKNYINVHDISDIYVEDNLLYITASGKDPYMYTKNLEDIVSLLNKKSQYIIRFIASFIGSILSLMVLCLLSKIVNNRDFFIQSVKTYFSNFYKYKGLLWELVKRDIKLKYRRSFLGLIWSLLNPLLMMLVLTIVFSSIFKRNIPNFPIYLLTGRIIFDFYSQATRASMDAIVTNSALIKKVYIPKYIFPLAKSLSAFVNLLFSLIAVVIVLIATGVKVKWTMLLFPLPMLYILVFATGVGLILATYTVFFRDIEHLYSIVLTAWMYFTPLFYPIEIIPEKYKFIIMLNPLYHIITSFRQIILYAQVPSLTSNIINISISLGALLTGLTVFYRNQDKFILYI